VNTKWNLHPLFALIVGILLLSCLPLYGFSETESSEMLDSQWVTIPEIFTDLERGPVKFPHDLHADALKKEGCKLCHQVENEKTLNFAFPKNADNQDRDSLINSYHDACIGCHEDKRKEDLATGPETCGECHLAEQKLQTKEYLAKDHQYYEGLQDTYHQDCLACHQKDHSLAKAAAEELDWKNFYVKTSKQKQVHWPKANFTYRLHNKHETALDNKCENCHYLSPETKAKLENDGKQPGCQDWLKEKIAGSDFTNRDSAHQKCIGCHIKNKQEQVASADDQQKNSNLFCKDCHNSSQEMVSEEQAVASIQCQQKEKILIQSQPELRMPAVPFNHSSHQTTTDSCQSCHHNNSLASCSECHTPEGIASGDNITLYEAYHAKTSELSCTGCHETEKKAAECSGCHESIAHNGKEDSCLTCHSGSLDKLAVHKQLPDPKRLIPESTPDKMKIGRLENEYHAAKFPHLEIVRTLTEISNNSQLSGSFHTDPTTACQSCHHNAPMVKDVAPPKCETCHTARNEPINDVPTLLGAFHQSCLGCHKEMSTEEKQLPQDCSGCHEPKINN
jgi:hypothetical protein